MPQPNPLTINDVQPYVCCGCGAPYELGAYKTCNCATNCGFLRGDLLAPALAAKPRCAWCNAIPTLANLDGEDLCHACCTKWARGEGMVDNDPEEATELLKCVTLLARTSGGTAGPDAALIAACDEAEAFLSAKARESAQ